MKRPYLPVLLCFLFSALQAQDVTTLAGMAGSSGFMDGTGTSARFNSPHDICVDASGNVFVADRYNHRIRQITPAGVVTTFAGSGAPGSTDGTGTAATFNEPWAVACDTSGNLYIADTKNYKIRMITPSAVVTTIAGTGVFGTTNGPVGTAQFGFPAGIDVSPDGSVIYVSDRMTHVIRKIEAGTVTTLAGTPFIPGSTDGTGAAARFDHPFAIALDTAGNIVVTDQWNNKIRRVSPSGVVTTLAGTGTAGSNNGSGFSATFNAPWAVTVDGQNNIYIGDGNNYTIRMISSGMVSTYAGITGMPGFTNGPVATATFQGVTGLDSYDAQQKLLVADSYNHMIRVITPSSNVTLTVSSDATNNVICLGDTVTVTASPAGLSDYTFYEGTIQLGMNQTGVLSLPGLSAGNHSIHCTARDLLGVTVISDTIVISVVTAPPASISPSGNQAICQGANLTLTASAGSTYVWSSGATIPAIQVSVAGTYTVTVSSAAGCSSQSPPVSVTVNPAPSAPLASGDTVCPGGQAVLVVQAQPGTTYQWFALPVGGNLLANGQTYTTGPLAQTTTFYVEAQSGGCSSAARTPVQVLVRTAPVASFTSSVLTTTGSGFLVGFMNTTQNGGTYAWVFGDPASATNTSSLSDPQHTYSQPGSYSVTLVATGPGGCVDSVLQNITLSRRNDAYIPTAFTPNGDGQNDGFRVRGSNIEAVEMSIYNQWGQLIFHAPVNLWDGTVSGDVVQTGTYIYVIEVTYTNDITEKHKGQVSVIR